MVIRQGSPGGDDLMGSAANVTSGGCEICIKIRPAAGHGSMQALVFTRRPVKKTTPSVACTKDVVMT